MNQRQYSPVQRTYAEALFGAARSLGMVERTQEEARLMLGVLKRSPRLLTFLESPHIDAKDKNELLNRVFQGRLGPLMINLLNVLGTRRRTTHLDEVLGMFLELVEQAEGVFQAQVSTAHELSFQDKLDLKTTLEKFTRARLRIDYLVEPRLIGGVVFRFRDTLIDTSLRGALTELRQRLKEAPLLAAPERA